MIKEKVLKAFLFALLCVLAGGFFVLQNGPFQAGVFPFSFCVGAVFILLGLLIGFFASLS